MKNIKKESQDLPDLSFEQRALSISQWASVLKDLHLTAKRMKNEAADLHAADPDAARKLHEKAKRLNRHARRLMNELKASIKQQDKKQYSDKVVPYREYQSYQQKGDDSWDPFGGSEGAAYQQDIEGRSQSTGRNPYFEKPPIDETIDLKESFWADMSINPQRVLNFQQFKRIRGPILANSLFGNARLPRFEVDKRIVKYLRRGEKGKGAYLVSGLSKGNREKGNYVKLPNSQDWVPLSEAVRRSGFGKSYEELYRELSGVNTAEMMRRFLNEFSRALSNVQAQQEQVLATYSGDDRVQNLIATSAYWEPRWQSLIAEKIYQLKGR